MGVWGSLVSSMSCKYNVVSSVQLDGSQVEKLASAAANSKEDKKTLFRLYKRVVNKGWSLCNERGKLGSELEQSVLAKYVSEGRHEALSDFDDHLDDLKKDWLNKDII